MALFPPLVLASVLLPLLFPLLALRPDWARLMTYALPLLPLPALFVAIFSTPGWELELPALLMGSVWQMDELRQLFLLLTAGLWTTAGCFAIGYMGPEHLRRFCVCWGFTLAGNLGLIMAGDIASFYSFFALMTFAAYGLVVHEGTDNSRRAGRVYITMGMLGEMAMLAGFIMVAQQAGSLLMADIPAAIVNADNQDLIVTLLVAGFGVKAGLPLLHFWLPLAHPVAPTPASAVLSGAMIKAGLLGWLLVLPLGELASPGAGSTLALFGAVAGLGAAVVGVCQRDPKAVLAYSSISQMGLMTIMTGVALSDPQRAPVLLPVIALYALHHGFAKGVLFLSTAVALPSGRWARGLVWLLIALPGLSLAGLPFTSGALAKLASKEALASEGLGFAWAGHLSMVSTAISVATLLLVLRFLYVLPAKVKTGGRPNVLWLGWSAATATSLVLFWVMPWQVDGLVKAPVWLPSGAKLWQLSWPLLTGLAIGLVAGRLVSRAPAIPQGDGVVVLELLAGSVKKGAGGVARLGTRLGSGGMAARLMLHTRAAIGLWADEQERHLRHRTVLVMVVIVLILTWL
ncbi:complex I subunit 5 family protein [Marinobacter salicampi]|uniref:complex I subunit 5 family protein n=1 Tax=Marinobacter salicampi TaxID=435907 RepID=UPI0014078DE0|nr:complex I subunit 5 family protein [Marinobacter salicampi]